MGVAMIGCEVIANFHLDAKMGPVACFSQNITKGVNNNKIMEYMKGINAHTNNYMGQCPAKSPLWYIFKISRTSKRKVTLALKCMANYKFSA